MIKMASATVEIICFQDEIPVILNTSFELEAYVKGHHVYKELWTPEGEEKLNIMMEVDNRVDKFSICVAKDQTVVGHSKEGDSGKFAKTIFYFLRSDTYCTGMLKFQENLKDVTKNQ